MTKNTYILAILLCSILSYGQQVTFHENTNYRATVLHQSLDEDGKHLLLESKTEQITKVDIFNDDFSEIIDVYSNKTKIDINTLPLGNFVIQARIGQKRIIMYLEKSDNESIAALDLKERKKDAEIAALDQKKQNELHKLQELKKQNEFNKQNELLAHNNEGNTLTLKAKSNQLEQNNNSVYYWVISESNSGFGSSKTMRLEYKEDLAKLISKNKLELKSSVGKNNKLIIYEIYNTSKFMPKQLRNPGYYKTEKSTFFNVVPIYASTNIDLDSYNP